MYLKYSTKVQKNPETAKHFALFFATAPYKISPNYLQQHKGAEQRVITQ